LDTMAHLVASQDWLPNRVPAPKRPVGGMPKPSLAQQAERYREAVAARLASLAAADRFYHDILVYQWRVDALEAQAQAVQAVVAPSSPHAAVVADVAVEAVRRHAAFEKCLLDIGTQHDLAVEALEGRAADYALLTPPAPASSGHAVKLVVGESERQSAMERYRRLAATTFEEIASEASAILRVDAGEQNLRQLASSLHRRREFWLSQLEETWGDWQQVTARMHNAGDIALEAWASIVAAVEACRSLPAICPTMLTSLAVVCARCIEVELLDSVGLSGLGDNIRPEASPDARVGLALLVLELVHESGGLHIVGEELLRAAPAEQGTLSTEVAAEVTRVLAEPELDGQSGSLASWLGWSLVAAVGTAARRGDEPRACALLGFCRRLGGSGLADAVRSAEPRGGLSPL